MSTFATKVARMGVIILAVAHYGFTVDELKEKEGLKEYLGFTR